MKVKIRLSKKGFTTVELLVATVIFPIIVIGISNSFDAIRKAYTQARELNEMYAVLSACPEIDRALEYNSLSTGTNCYPNDSFKAEGESTQTITYSPSLTVTDTTSLDSSDPLRLVPDSKVVEISVPYLHSPAPALDLKILITRNGIGQQ
jgi:Tfp pilus assembly protein PilE